MCTCSAAIRRRKQALVRRRGKNWRNSAPKSRSIVGKGLGPKK